MSVKELWAKYKILESQINELTDRRNIENTEEINKEHENLYSKQKDIQLEVYKILGDSCYILNENKAIIPVLGFDMDELYEEVDIYYD